VFVGMGINWIGEFGPEIGKVLKRKKQRPSTTETFACADE